jgi:predicted  nucleic acid-binding Zn-ribbon protein
LDESDFKLPTPEAQALKTENITLQNAVNDLTDENVRLKDETAALKAELDHLRLTLEHKEEILKLQDEIIRLHKTYAPGPDALKF